MRFTPNGMEQNKASINALYATMNGLYCVGGIIGGLVSGVMAQ